MTKPKNTDWKGDGDRKGSQIKPTDCQRQLPLCCLLLMIRQLMARTTTNGINKESQKTENKDD